MKTYTEFCFYPDFNIQVRTFNEPENLLAYTQKRMCHLVNNHKLQVYVCCKGDIVSYRPKFLKYIMELNINKVLSHKESYRLFSWTDFQTALKTNMDKLEHSYFDVSGEVKQWFEDNGNTKQKGA